MADDRETRNRIAKAYRVIELLDDIASKPVWQEGPITAEMVDGFDEELWTGIGALMGARPLSIETRAVVLMICRAREAGIVRRAV